MSEISWHHPIIGPRAQVRHKHGQDISNNLSVPKRRFRFIELVHVFLKGRLMVLFGLLQEPRFNLSPCCFMSLCTSPSQSSELDKCIIAVASFVYNHYADMSDILKLGWLPISYRRDYHITRTICKALYQNCWPTCLKLVEHKPARALRSSCERRLEPSTVPGTLQDSAAMLFNSLPQDIKNCTELKVFDSKCRNHFITLATSSF